MSSRIFQSVIIQMKDATDRVIGVADNQGFVVACSELSMIGSYLDDMQGQTGDVPDQLFTTQERTYKLLGSPDSQFDYAVFVNGHDSAAHCICVLAAVAMSEAKTNYEEKHDKATFIKNIISDNILPGDVYVRAKELHFSADVPRVVFLARQIDKTDVTAIEVLQNMFPDRQKDFVLSLTETDLVLIKEMQPTYDNAELFEIAESITEIKSICDCGAKATVNARFDDEGNLLTAGEQVVLGGNDRYKAMCRKCWLKLQAKSEGTL